MKKLFIYILIVGLVGTIFSIAIENAGASRLNSSITSVISNVSAGVAHADTLYDPQPTPPPPIPK